MFCFEALVPFYLRQVEVGMSPWNGFRRSRARARSQTPGPGRKLVASSRRHPSLVVGPKSFNHSHWKCGAMSQGESRIFHCHLHQIPVPNIDPLIWLALKIIVTSSPSPVESCIFSN